MTAELIATRGLPASGKTTWSVETVTAAEPGTAVRVSRDDLRGMLFGPTYSQPVHDCEEQVTAVQRATVEHALRRGQTVIVDDMNLRLGYLRDWAKIAAKHGAPFRVQSFTADVDECVARDTRRVANGGRGVGENLIRDLHARFRGTVLPTTWSEPALAPKPYTGTPGKPKAVIVDIDGTVALHEGVRGPYDTSRYHLDRPNPAVIEQVHLAAAAGYALLITSGRSAEFRDVTTNWLAEHVLTPRDVTIAGNVELIMRKQGDTRNDAVVKLELFDQHIRDHYDVRAVYDDRNRVVEMWRALGLTVFQVAPGDF